MHLSEYWESPLGDIACDGCGRTWPCHLSAWLLGGDFHRGYGGDLTWRERRG